MRTLGVLTIALLLGAAVPAQARFNGPHPSYGETGGTPVDDLPSAFSNGGSCVRLCEYDFTPCDPDYWKVADRRCNFNQKGGF